MTQPNGNVVASRVGTACTQLTGKGYCVLEDVVDAGEIERLSRDLSVRFAQTPFCDGDFYGRSTKRFGGLLRHSAHAAALVQNTRSEEHTSELQSLMRISYAVFCLKKKKQQTQKHHTNQFKTTRENS